MGRRPNPKRRIELLGMIVDYILAHGLADLSLRPLAKELKTNARMLLYYFGSSEELISAAITEIWNRQYIFLDQEMQRRKPRGISELLRVFWRAYASKQREPFLRLMFEMWGLAFQHPKKFAGFLQNVNGFFSAFEEGLKLQGVAADRSRAIATHYLATLRGLMLDLLTTGDRARVDAAIDEIASDLEREIQASNRKSGKRALRA